MARNICRVLVIPFGDFRGIGFGPLHGGIAQIGNDHIDRRPHSSSASLDQVQQFLMGAVVWVAPMIIRLLRRRNVAGKGVIGLTVGKQLADHLRRRGHPGHPADLPAKLR